MLEVHVLASGSDGNCTVIESDGEAIMIDAGISCKKILHQMEQEGVDKECIKAILITHEHSDHVSGAGPTARKLGVPIMTNEATFSQIPNIGKVDFIPFESTRSFDVGHLHITPLPTSHNAIEPNAFLTEVDDKKVLLATDTGSLSFQIEAALKVADIAVIEANYDQRMLDEGPYPPSLKRLIGSDHGHMCNVDTGNALRRTMTESRRQIFLAHLSRTNNEPDIARETVSKITGIRRLNIDCLEFLGDSRTLRA